MTQFACICDSHEDIKGRQPPPKKKKKKYLGQMAQLKQLKLRMFNKFTIKVPNLWNWGGFESEIYGGEGVHKSFVTSTMNFINTPSSPAQCPPASCTSSTTSWQRWRGQSRWWSHARSQEKCSLSSSPGIASIDWWWRILKEQWSFKFIYFC